MQRIMKKTIAILLSVSCLFGLNSCFKTEEDIFDQSPAQRLNKLTSDYREVLSGSENGWVLQYFASETEQGYPFVMKFDKSGKVTIAGNNSVSTGGVYKEESSTYDFVQDMSVVLTFDTYNEIFHEFSSPQTDGVGHGGDYEFQMKGMSADKDTIYVMGKKSGIDMRLVRFPMGAQYTDAAGAKKTVDSWADYFKAIEASTARLFNNKISGYTLSSGDETFDVDGLGVGVMALTPVGLSEIEAASRTYYRGIIVNLDNTVRLSSPFEGEKGKFSVQDLAIDAANTKMTSPDGTVTLNAPTVEQLFKMAGASWMIDPETMTAKTKTLYDAAVEGAATKKRTVEFGYQYDSKTGKICMVVKLLQAGTTKASVALFYLDATVASDGTLTYTADGSGDRNAQSYSKNVPGLLDFVKGMAGSYGVTAETPFYPAQMKFVNKADGNDTFTAKLN